VLGYMTFYVDNAVQIAELAGFVPLTEAQIAEQHEKIVALTGASE
jgi:hypothetical protein